MRTLLLITFLFILTGSAFASDHTDSIKIDKPRIEFIIQQIKDKYEPHHYSLITEDFNIRDITFVYPDKIGPNDFPWINVQWKGETILMYTFEYDYSIRSIIDLR